MYFKLFVILVYVDMCKVAIFIASGYGMRVQFIFLAIKLDGVAITE